MLRESVNATATAPKDGADPSDPLNNNQALTPKILLKAAVAQEYAPTTALSTSDMAKLKTLDEILDSRFDNDPRMDTELKDLSPALKERLRSKYSEIPSEKRNDRGTIVFLLGREINTTKDVEFLQEVLAERPCLGLESCSQDMRTSGSHAEGGLEVTLAYPQVVALKSMEGFLERADQNGMLRDRTPLVGAVFRSLENGKSSQVPLVSRMARELQERYSK